MGAKQKKLRNLLIVLISVSCYCNIYSQETAEEYVNRGMAEFETENFREAIQNFNKAIEINSYYVEAYYNRASSKSQLGDYRGAIADYTKVIKTKTEFCRCLRK